MPYVSTTHYLVQPPKGSGVGLATEPRSPPAQTPSLCRWSPSLGVPRHHRHRPRRLTRRTRTVGPTPHHQATQGPAASPVLDPTALWGHRVSTRGRDTRLALRRLGGW